MRRTKLLIILMMLAALFIWPVSARVSTPVASSSLACACCADEGEWYERSDSISVTQLGELNRLRFSRTANRYLAPADESELASAYSLSHKRSGRRWELRFRDEHGNTGTLSFTLPASAISFGADLHDSPAGGLGPSLYKEWRLSGAAQVTGIFKKGMAGLTRFRLILQGRGNRCEQAEDFKHWTLQVSGGRSTQSFYGSLNDPQ